MVHRATGQVFLSSIKSGYDDMPADVVGNADYIAIPHKKELDLVKPLALAFIRQHCPAELRRTQAIFARPGAYRHFRDLLKQKRLVDLWELFESEQTRAALQQWCAEKGLLI